MYSICVLPSTNHCLPSSIVASCFTFTLVTFSIYTELYVPCWCLHQPLGRAPTNGGNILHLYVSYWLSFVFVLHLLVVDSWTLCLVWNMLPCLFAIMIMFLYFNFLQSTFLNINLSSCRWLDEQLLCLFIIRFIIFLIYETTLAVLHCQI